MQSWINHIKQAGRFTKKTIFYFHRNNPFVKRKIITGITIRCIFTVQKKTKLRLVLLIIVQVVVIIRRQFISNTLTYSITN